LSETGAIGLVFVLSIFIKSVVMILKKKQNKVYILMLIFAIIFLGMFDHYFLTLQQGQLMLAFIIGISISKS
jgi:UDP-N-acetylmuramyl pentapeptide phosphotransferase/UDP-N-acetylglucosamine-1-phosphate transferase